MPTYNHIPPERRVPVRLTSFSTVLLGDSYYKLESLIPNMELIRSQSASDIYNFLSSKWAEGIYLTFSYDDLPSFRSLWKMIPTVYARNMLIGKGVINAFPYALFVENQADPDSSLAEQVLGREELNRRLTPGPVLP